MVIFNSYVSHNQRVIGGTSLFSFFRPQGLTCLPSGHELLVASGTAGATPGEELGEGVFMGKLLGKSWISCGSDGDTLW